MAVAPPCDRWAFLGVTSPSFSPDGTTFAAGGADGTVRIWDARDGRRESCKTRWHKGGVLSVSNQPRRPDPGHGGADGTVRIWDARDGRELRVLRGYQASVMSVSFSPDGRTITSGSQDGSVRIWNAARGRAISGTWGHLSGVTSISYGPDGQTIASGSEYGTVRIWDAEDGREQYALSRARRAVRCRCRSAPAATELPSSRVLGSSRCGICERRWWLHRDLASGLRPAAALQHAADRGGRCILRTAAGGVLALGSRIVGHLMVDPNREGRSPCGLGRFRVGWWTGRKILLAYSGGSWQSPCCLETWVLWLSAGEGPSGRHGMAPGGRFRSPWRSY